MLRRHHGKRHAPLSAGTAQASSRSAFCPTVTSRVRTGRGGKRTSSRLPPDKSKRCAGVDLGRTPPFSSHSTRGVKCAPRQSHVNNLLPALVPGTFLHYILSSASQNPRGRHGHYYQFTHDNMEDIYRTAKGTQKHPLRSKDEEHPFNTFQKDTH